MRTARDNGMHLRWALVGAGIVGMLAVLLGTVAVGSAQTAPDVGSPALQADPAATDIFDTWEPPEVNKEATTKQLRPGDSVQFRIAVTSPNEPDNQKVWYNVKTRDAIDPALRIDSVRVVPDTHTVAIVGNTVIVNAASMEPGEKYGVYIQCTLVDGSGPGPSIINAVVVDSEEEPGVPSPFGPQYADPVTLTVLYTVDLPVIVRNYPPGLERPTLNAIDNADGDGAYTVRWSAVPGATEYILQEAQRSDFSDAILVYRGASRARQITGRGPTRYFYRVRARNSAAVSRWSDAEQVDVVWELEPNDNALTQANGPLVSGLTYFGAFPSGTDVKDYFYLDLPVQSLVELWLTNIPAGHDYDLLLYDADLKLKADSRRYGNRDEHILIDVDPGRYYVLVYHYDPSGSTQAYHLQVEYE